MLMIPIRHGVPRRIEADPGESSYEATEQKVFPAAQEILRRLRCLGPSRNEQVRHGQKLTKDPKKMRRERYEKENPLPGIGCFVGGAFPVHCAGRGGLAERVSTGDCQFQKG